MKNRNNTFLAGIIVAAIAVGTGSAWLANNLLKDDTPSAATTNSVPTPEVVIESPNPVATTTPNETKVQQTPNATSTPNKTETSQKPPTSQNIAIYWIDPQAADGLGLLPTKLVVAEKSDSKEILEAALTQLLSGQNDLGYTTTIPAGTKLLSLKTDKTGVRVDLSGDFASDGGSTSMMGRLGQIIYTATTLDPKGKVWISVDGKPLEYLGGEGIEVSQPMTRSQFEENF